MASATPTSGVAMGFPNLAFFISTIIIIAVLLVVLYLVKKFGVHRMRSRYIRVLDSLPLGKNTVVYLVKLKDEYVFIACTPTSTDVIGKLTDPEVIKDLEVDDIGSKFSKILFSKLGKNFLKGQIDRIDDLK